MAENTNVTSRVCEEFGFLAKITRRVDMERTAELVTIVDPPELNDPREAAAQEDALRQALDEGEAALRVLVKSFDDRKAQVALLRSAYLVAYAALGCVYVLRSQFELVRRQIACPDETILERFVVHRWDSHPGRALAYVQRPRSLESVIVKIDEHLVFLPELKRGPTIYERLAKRKLWPPRRHFFGKTPDAIPFDRRAPSICSTSLTHQPARVRERQPVISG